MKDFYSTTVSLCHEKIYVFAGKADKSSISVFCATLGRFYRNSPASSNVLNRDTGTLVRNIPVSAVAAKNLLQVPASPAYE